VAATAQRIAEVLAGLRAATARMASGHSVEGRLPFGLAPVDALLGGGLPRGRLSELWGPRSSGRMAATLGALAAAHAAGELAALVDVADALDVRAAAAAGVALTRLLWVRPRALADGIRAVDLLLDAGGFGLVVLYWCGRPHGDARLRGEAQWVRLARRAERAGSAVLAVGDRPLVGSFAAVGLELERARACFSGSGAAPRLLDGVDGRVRVARSKLGPLDGVAPLPLRVAAK
jgi:hypothetical protein